jgi:hypothetical protein
MLSRIAGNMLNLDVGTVKRKIDSNEYDDEIYHEVQVTKRPAKNRKREEVTMTIRLVVQLGTQQCVFSLSPF